MRENSATDQSDSVYPSAPLPAEADPKVDSWDTLGERPYRLIWSKPLPLDDPWLVPVAGFNDTDVRVVVTQFADGSIGTTGADGPLVYVGQGEYAPDKARALAAACIAAADLADRWTGAV